MKKNSHKILISFFVISISIHAQLDYSGQWKIKNTNGKDSTNILIQIKGSNIAIKSNNIYKGKFDKKNGNFSASYVYPSIGDVPNIPQFQDQRVRERLTIDNSKFTGVFKPTEKTTISWHRPQYRISDSGVEKLEDDVVEFNMAPISKFEVYDQQGEIIDFTSNFSNPFPEVKLDLTSIHVVPTSKNKVSLSFSGVITDVLADIVDEGLADIESIYIDYLDLSTESIRITKKLTYTKSIGTPNKWRPYAHAYIVKVPPIVVPLVGMETMVNIRAVNALGNETTASIIIKSKEMKEEVNVGESESFFYDYQAYEHSDGLNSGYANPVQISLSKSDYIRPSGYDFDQDSITYSGRKLKMVANLDRDKPNDFYLSAPLMGLGEIPEKLKNVPNLFAVDDISGDFKVQHGTKTQELHWNFTAHSPRNIYTYAMGLKYKHSIYSLLFLNHDLVKVLGIYDKEKPKKQIVNGGDIKISDINLGRIPSKMLEFTIPFKNELIGKTVYIRAVIKEKGKNKKKQEALGVFKIGTLKTIIVGVDGFAYEAAKQVISAYPLDGYGFQMAFNRFKNDDGVNEKVLSAIPTVTWCNWTGIYSGQPPGKHGINGNSYLGFNSSEAKFFEFIPNTHLGPNKLNQISGAVARFNNKAYSKSESLFDKIGQVYPNGYTTRLKAYSIYPWYDKVENMEVSSTPGNYIWQTLKRIIPHGLELTKHGVKNARRLDLISSEKFRDKINLMLQEREKALDLISIYFPGPDNIAHYLGDQKPEDFDPPEEGYEFEEDLNGVKYNIGPLLPDVNKPLKAIEEHAIQVTNYYFKKNTKSIVDNGLMYSTIFVLTADHGLHAFNNDEKNMFNIFPEDILSLVRKHLTKYLLNNRSYYNDYKKEMNKIFPQTKQVADFVNSYTGYSPNGGMAHYYTRTGSKKMDNFMAHQSAKILYLGAKSSITGNENIKSAKLKKKKNRVLRGRYDNGALGKKPAIFIKACQSRVDICENRLTRKYQWVKEVNSLEDPLITGSISEYLTQSGHREDWPDFEARLEEMNDKSFSSRSGDVVIFTDGAMGYLTVLEGEEDNGWHGGATVSESFIPMFINIPGKVVDEAFIKNGFEKVKKKWLEKTSPNSKYLRNWHLSEVLEAIYKEIPRN